MSIETLKINESNKRSCTNLVDEAAYTVKHNDYLICVTGGCTITIGNFLGSEFKICSIDTDTVTIKDDQSNTIVTITEAKCLVLNIDLSNNFLI